MPVFGPGGVVVAALELRVRDLRSDLRLMQPALVVAARSLSRELTASQPHGRFPLSLDARLDGVSRNGCSGSAYPLPRT